MVTKKDYWGKLIHIEGIKKLFNIMVDNKNIGELTYKDIVLKDKNYKISLKDNFLVINSENKTLRLLIDVDNSSLIMTYFLPKGRFEINSNNFYVGSLFSMIRNFDINCILYNIEYYLIDGKKITFESTESDRFDFMYGG